MTDHSNNDISRWGRIIFALVVGVSIVFLAFIFAGKSSISVNAAPIDPPEGYPKFNTSTKEVSPTLAFIGGETLHYYIEIVNTGAYAGYGVSFSDVIPDNTLFNDDAYSSVPPDPQYSDGVLTWNGDVGFDDSVVISFSVDVDPAYSGVVTNTSVISHPVMENPITLTAYTMVTDDPVLVIDKSSNPDIPGAVKPLTYTLSVQNIGQPANDLTLDVMDEVPNDTTFRSVDQYGGYDPTGDVVSWTRNVSLSHNASVDFVFSVDVNEVPSGTIIDNVSYSVSGPGLDTAYGEVYTVTVLDPILLISKEVWPHPPGSNQEMTYTLTVLNKGSLATDLVVSDTVPDGFMYVRGGNLSDGVVTWDYPRLDTGETAYFTFTVYIDDVAEVTIFNEFYGVCSSEGVCQSGEPLESLVLGPNFTVDAEVDPIAKKPGGGTGPVTPTMVVENLGPGTALDATALLYFTRISVSENDLKVIPNRGGFASGPDCGDKCSAYKWIGNIVAGEILTFTTIEGQSTIGGEPGTIYTATLVITDTLGDYTTEPITGTASGEITHYANLIPQKSAPAVIGAGQEMTYTINVRNSALSTDVPPYPYLTETVPMSVTLLNISDGGESMTIGDRTMISWTLPSMGPGENTTRAFSVEVDDDLVSGTEIVNDLYRVTWSDILSDGTYVLSNTGEPITTVVKEVGLIDSFKEVTPTLARPGTGIVLTYVVNVVNSSGAPLVGVSVYDYLPWQSSTYQRDAVSSSGQIISDIVSIEWDGNVDALSSELITFTVIVDDFYEGPVTNTAVIDHPNLFEPVVVYAVAYITNDPVLSIWKKATPDPVMVDGQLKYNIFVENLGQQATELVVTDTIPMNTSYVDGSASGGGQLFDGYVLWEFPVLNPGEKQMLSFQVSVLGGDEVVNSQYSVTCDEGVTAYGEPVVTIVRHPRSPYHYLPLIFKE
jgi:uncharacterized repeat protein (TIGR01451 family)